MIFFLSLNLFDQLKLHFYCNVFFHNMFAGGRVVGSKAIVQLDSTSLGGVFATQNIWIEISLKGREDGNTCVFVVIAIKNIWKE